MLSRFKLYLLLSLTALTGPVALAQLTAYEGFQYPVLRQTPYLSPVTNKSPDGDPLKYFSEFDTHASRSPYDYTIQIVEGSIPTQGTPFPFTPKGNSLSWAREWLDAYGTIDPNFQFDTARNNPPIYVSFLLRAKQGAPVRQIAMAFSNGSSQRLQMGLDDSANTGRPKFFACVASPQPIREYGSKSFEYDKTYFVVAKVTTSDTRKDTVQVNVYGPGDQVPNSDRGMHWDIEAGDWTNFLVSDVAISLYGGDAGGLQFDELRIGSSWAAVAVAPPKAASPQANSDPKKSADSGTVGAQTTESDAAGTPEETQSSPVVLGLIVVGIIAFIIGGVAFYLFVLKPNSKKQPVKPAAPPPKPVTQAPKAAPVVEKAESPAPEAKPAAPAAPKAPPPRKPKKPPPPR